MPGLNVLSLFDGMGCGYQALKRAGIPVNAYFASEVDKHAIKIAKKNHPVIFHLGDVTKWPEWQLPKIDLVIGGSPCQGFSFSGKQKAFDDPRSKLFFEFVYILGRAQQENPSVKFLLENVRMKKEHLGVLSTILGVDPILINSNLVSAQNRPRYYWTNLKGVSLPKDNKINFEKIKEPAPSEKYQLSEKIVNGFLKKSKRRKKTNPGSGFNDFNLITEKVSCLTARYHKCSLSDPYVKNGCNLRKLTPIECERLQTLPDNYTEGVSDTQRYKMLGNGWTVDVIAHIFSNL